MTLNRTVLLRGFRSVSTAWEGASRPLGAYHVLPSLSHLKRLIEIFTDKGDVVIDPCAGSGTTLYAAASLGRKAYGFEVNKQFYNDANEKVLKRIQISLFQ